MAMPLERLDYTAEYKEIQPSLFRESEVLDTLLKSIFDVCDKQQEDLLWISQNLLNIDAAERSQLDFIGNIVGQPRFLSDFNTEPYFGYDGSYQSKTFGSSTDPEIGGYWNSRSYFNTATSRKLNDDEYRRLIKARVIYNQSNCTANDLLEVINLITNSKNNTVQMLKHGLVQINSDDSTGILSYFVDRLLMMDSILPVAAGVRVGLENVASVPPTFPWYIESLSVSGSLVALTALKQSSDRVAFRATITITPNVAKVVEYLLGSGGVLALDYAMSQIIGDGIDWVLDPANNAVKYTVPIVADPDALGEYYYQNSYYPGNSSLKKFSSWSAACNDPSSIANAGEGSYVTVSDGTTCTYYSAGNYRQINIDIYEYINQTYNPNAPTTEQKSIPIDTVAAQVISNAEAGDVPSQEAVKAVALEGFAAGEHDAALDTAAVPY